MILFTADYHIKLGQKNVPVDWSKGRYALLFDLIYSVETEISLHIIGGDLFDRLPTIQELEIYFSFISRISKPTIIFDGNHEATNKNQTFFDFLKIATQKINPLVTIVTESKEYDTFSILPYCDLHKPKSIEKLNSNKALFTHVRGEIPPHVKPEVDLDRFNNFPIVYAGDLHAHSNTQRNIVYPGSPVTTSFHRQKVSTGYLLIDENDLTNWKWREFKVPQLLRKKVSSPDEMVKSTFDHTVYELEGDIQDLAKIQNSELLDKRVLKRSSETTLILTKDMSIAAELSEYLTYILELDSSKVEKLMGVFNDYT